MAKQKAWQQLLVESKESALEIPNEADQAKLALLAGQTAESKKELNEAISKYEQAKELYSKLISARKSAFSNWKVSQTKARMLAQRKTCNLRQGEWKTLESQTWRSLLKSPKEVLQASLAWEAGQSAESKDQYEDALSKYQQTENLYAKAISHRKNILTALALLNDRLKWYEASVVLQDIAIKAIGNKLGSAYKWVETKKFQCNGVEA